MSNAGRPPGQPKTGGAHKGSVKTNTKQVKDTIKHVFYDRLGGADYLEKIAKKDEALFCSLLAKLIPQEVRAELDVNHHHTVDLGAAIAEANARVAIAANTPTPAPFDVIDVTPEPVSAKDLNE